MSPLVSIIIPVYNSEKYLAECIDSALAQTWINKEIIVVDDGSTDSSLNVAKKFGNKAISIFHQENKGASAARNKGLSEAAGEFIQFLDADDLLSHDKIEEQVKLLINNPNKIAVCSTVHFNDGEDHKQQLSSPHEDAFLLDDNPVHFLINLWGGYGEQGSMVSSNAWLTPKHIIEKAGPWNEQLTLDDDGEFFCRALLNSEGVVKSNGLNYYRKYTHAKSLSAARQQHHFLSSINAAHLKYTYLCKYDSSANLRKAYLRNLFDIKLNLYPKYPSLLKNLDDKINSVDYTFDFKPQFATKKGQILSNLLGWKIAKRLQIIVQRIFN